jgi:single-strand DNA-binding protein
MSINKVILSGRATKDPEIRWTTGENPICGARYTLAVQKRFHKDGEPDADFFPCVTWGKTAEWADKYIKKGQKYTVVGRLQNRQYKRSDGSTAIITEVIVEDHDFASSRSDTESAATAAGPRKVADPWAASKDGADPFPGANPEDIPFT